ncbi:MAG: phytanoyl-CoA dioxygenase family protein [Vitreoscilla sp.]|nr:phytanoyl-CoA dioxygenase family protein [Vitreoscilla sp.]
MGYRLSQHAPAEWWAALQSGARAALLSPWWAASVLGADKSFVDNPLLGSPRLNAWGLHRWRVYTAHVLAARRRARLTDLLDGMDASTFERNGFIIKRNVLPDDEFQQLRRQVLGHRAPARERVHGDTVTRHIAVNPGLLRAAPGLAALLQGPLWNGLTRYVAACDRAPMACVQSVQTHATLGDRDPQTHLHADTFHPTMRAWYFLTDVGNDDSPFCYVPGSHRLTPARLAWEHERSLRGPGQGDRHAARGSAHIDRNHLAALGLGHPARLPVPANTLIVADTFGFHKQARARRPTMRIEVWARDRPRPFLPGPTDAALDLLGLRDHRVDLHWALRDLAGHLGAGRNPWQRRGLLAPDAPSPPGLRPVPEDHSRHGA